MPIIFVFIVSLFLCGVHASQLESVKEELTEQALTEDLSQIECMIKELQKAS
jgi:hypothetical protein